MLAWLELRFDLRLKLVLWHDLFFGWHWLGVAPETPFVSERCRDELPVLKFAAAQHWQSVSAASTERTESIARLPSQWHQVPPQP